MEAKTGELVMIRGKEHIFSKASAFAMNKWLKWLALGIDDKGIELLMFTSDGREYSLFPVSEIKEALETAERNKTHHGL